MPDWFWKFRMSMVPWLHSFGACCHMGVQWSTHGSMLWWWWCKLWSGLVLEHCRNHWNCGTRGASPVALCRTMADIPTTTPLAESISRHLKRRGFKFVGPTMLYSFMQATGMVLDHTVCCFRYKQILEMHKDHWSIYPPHFWYWPILLGLDAHRRTSEVPIRKAHRCTW